MYHKVVIERQRIVAFRVERGRETEVARWPRDRVGTQAAGEWGCRNRASLAVPGKPGYEVAISNPDDLLRYC